MLQESPHPKFTREGNDLIYTHRLPLSDALCGTTVSLTLLDGRPINVPVKEVRHGRMQRVYGDPDVGRDPCFAPVRRFADQLSDRRTRLLAAPLVVAGLCEALRP